MHEILRVLHPFVAAVRLLIDTLYRLGPGILTKHTMACAWLICSLCVLAGCFDLVRGRRLDAVLWAGAAGLLFAAFRFETKISGPRLTAEFAIAAVVVGVLLLIRALSQGFRDGGRPA